MYMEQYFVFIRQLFNVVHYTSRITTAIRGL